MTTHEQFMERWYEQKWTVEEAARYLDGRARQRFERAMGWSMLDVAAVLVLVHKAKELGFVRDDA